MNKRSLRKNAVLNALKSVISFIFPLITYPYAARMVGVDQMGHVTYVLSFINFFTLIAVFGVTTYAVREGAAVRDDSDRFKVLASKLWSFNLCTTLLSLVLLILFTVAYPKLHSYVPVIMIQSQSIVFTALGADWVPMVYEDYGYTTLRGIIINVVNVIILFVFVKSPEDYLIYAFLTVSTAVLSGMVNLIYIRRYVKFSLSVSGELFELIPKLRPFFINEMSIAVYVGADVFLLGCFKSDYYVGIYSVAVKVYTIVKSVFIAIFSVTISRLSKHVSKGETEEFNGIISGVISTFIILGFPAMTGMILYARPIVLLLGGPEYERSMYSLMILSVALIFAIFGGIVTGCVDIPLGYEKVNSHATIIAALENTVLNIPLILLWNEIGAAVTTVTAEITVLLICVINLVRNGHAVHKLIRIRDIRDTAAGVLLIVAAFFVLRVFITDYIWQLAAGIAVSVLLYFGTLVLFKNEQVMHMLHRITDRLGKTG